MAAILFHVINREITTETFDTLEKAKEEMLRQYNLYIDNADEGEIEENSAWMNSCDNEVHDDWMIVDLRKELAHMDKEMLWNILKEHIGHKVEIVSYGDSNNPSDICLEDIDTNEVILDAEIYTLCAREVE